MEEISILLTPDPSDLQQTKDQSGGLGEHRQNVKQQGSDCYGNSWLGHSQLHWGKLLFTETSHEEITP